MDRDPLAAVFQFPRRKEPASILRVDLEAAGIPARDALDRVVDFHALRHTFITNLAQGGVHPKTAQAPARHSTITLTMDRSSHSSRVAFADRLRCGALCMGKRRQWERCGRRPSTVRDNFNQAGARTTHPWRSRTRRPHPPAPMRRSERGDELVRCNDTVQSQFRAFGAPAGQARPGAPRPGSTRAPQQTTPVTGRQ